MSNNMEDQDLIQGFLRRELSIQQAQTLKKRIKEDKDFADNLAFQISLQNAFNHKKQEEALTASQDIAIKNKQKKRPILKIVYIGLAVAAAIFLLFMINPVWFTNVNKSQDERVASLELEEMTKEVNQAGTHLGGDTDIMLSSIGNEQYDLAIAEGEKILSKQADPCLNDKVNYNLGRLYLYHDKSPDKFQKAKDVLNCVYKYYGEDYREITIHLTRVYIGLRNNTMANEIVEQIPAPVPIDITKNLDKINQ